MRLPQYINKFRITFLSCICLFASNLLFYSQAQVQQKQLVSPPLSVCEVLKNKKRYNKKEVIVKGIFQVSAETSVFLTEENCSDYEMITVGEDDSFHSVNTKEILQKYEEATNLYSAIKKNLSGSNEYVNLFAGSLQVEITTKGIFYTSNKRKYGHLNGYKNMFLLTKIEEIGNSKFVQ